MCFSWFDEAATRIEAVQSLLKVAIHSAAVPFSLSEEGLLSLRVAEPLDLGWGRGRDVGERVESEGETDFSPSFPILTLSVHPYFQETLYFRRHNLRTQTYQSMHAKQAIFANSGNIGEQNSTASLSSSGFGGTRKMLDAEERRGLDVNGPQE